MDYAGGNAFSDGLGIRAYLLAKGNYDGTSQALVTTGGQFTITAANVTPVLASIGGRPAVKVLNSGSTATDGLNITGVAASLILQPNKRARIRCSYYSVAQADGDFAFGFGVVGTTMINSDPTNHIMIRKLAAANFSIRARKASGTAETFTLGAAMAADGWWDFEFEVKPSATAGLGTVVVAGGFNVAAGGAMTALGSFAIATQCPDTVAMAPFVAVRAGSAANVTSYIGGLHWAVEA